MLSTSGCFTSRPPRRLHLELIRNGGKQMRIGAKCCISRCSRYMYYGVRFRPDFIPIPFPKALPQNLSKQQKTGVNCFKFDGSKRQNIASFLCFKLLNCVSSVVGLCIMSSVSVGLRPYQWRIHGEGGAAAPFSAAPCRPTP